MRNFELPRRESAAHVALRALHNIGGAARIPAWMRVLDWKATQLVFSGSVVGRLERAGLISVEGADCTVTSAGRAYLGVPAYDEAPQVAAEPAGPRYVAPDRALNLAKHFPPRPLRPEGDEFRAIPSLMADQRIEYRPGVVTANA